MDTFDIIEKDIESTECPFCNHLYIEIILEILQYDLIHIYTPRCMQCDARGPSSLESLKECIELWKNRP